MTHKQRLVVIGNGMAGARFVEELVARGGNDLFDIVVFGEEPCGNYNRILLSSVLAGSHDPKDIFINPLSWYEANGVRLHVGVKAGWIYRPDKTVHASGGLVEPYDKLVIATGSVPFVPSVQGLTTENGGFKEGAFLFRTMEDCQAIMRYASGVKRVAVIGGGLLGLEAARGLLNRGLEVHVVHLMQHLMEVQLDALAGTMLKQTMEQMGVRIHLEKATTGVLGDDRISGVVFKDGSTLDCDMLIVSVGVRPNVELAKRAALSIERGIVVNDDLSCRNDPDVHAIGECSQLRGKTYGLVAPLWEQARILAERLSGRDPHAVYTGSRVSTKLKIMGVDLAVMGERDANGAGDEVVTYLEPSRGVYKKLIVRGDRLAGAILLGDGLATPSLLRAFDRDTVLPSNRAELLFPMAWQAQANVADLPDTAMICTCNGVSKGKLVAAVVSGHDTPEALSRATRAGTGCGACKPQVLDIIRLARVAAPAPEPIAKPVIGGPLGRRSEPLNGVTAPVAVPAK